jgi:hypothetical protein
MSYEDCPLPLLGQAAGANTRAAKNDDTYADLGQVNQPTVTDAPEFVSNPELLTGAKEQRCTHKNLLATKTGMRRIPALHLLPFLISPPFF